jgi:hypothetical protein
MEGLAKALGVSKDRAKDILEKAVRAQKEYEKLPLYFEQGQGDGG